MPEPITSTQQLLDRIAEDPDFIYRDNGLIMIPTEDYLAIYHPTREPAPRKRRSSHVSSAASFQLPGKRGGRRPGAGAPRGNLNGLKHGRRSRRFQVAAALMAAVPELRHLYRALATESDRHERQRILALVGKAYNLAATDPVLARAIKTATIARVRSLLTQIHDDPEIAENIERVIMQSIAQNSSS